AEARDGGIDIAQLEVASNAVHLTASGHAAIGTTGASSLTYTIDASDLAAAARLAGMNDVSGSAVVEGKLTGNRLALQTTGTLSANNLHYGSTADVLTTRTQYDITVPDLSPAAAHGSIDASASTIKAAGQELRTATLKVTYADRAADVAA